MTHRDLPTTHTAFGLRWHIPFTMLPFSPAEGGEPDVVVVEEPAVIPEGAVAAGPLRWVAGPDVVHELPGVARLRVSHGRRISVEPLAGFSPEGLWLLLMGPAAALLLQQRGVVPLHASTFATPSGAVAVCGHSGAGKSTLLAALHQRGHHALADDLTPLHLVDGVPMVGPGTGVVKLWADTTDALGIDTDGLALVRAHLSKRFVPLPAADSTLTPLRVLVLLSTHNRPTTDVVPQHHAHKFKVLLDHTWQKMTIRRMGLHQSHFDTITATAARVPVLKVSRPDGVPISGSNLVDHLLRALP